MTKPIVLPAPLTDNDYNARSLQGTPCRVTMDDAGSDSLGRRHFTMEWNGQHPLTGAEYARAQCFFAVPSSFFEFLPGMG